MKFDRRKFLKVTGMSSLGLVSCSKPQEGRSLSAKMDTMDPWLEIDLGNMAWNLTQIRKRVHPRPVMAVIKANAYGHGLVPVAEFLESKGISGLAVGKIQEALKIRESGVNSPLLNFGPFTSQEAEEIVRLGISQSVFTDAVTLLAQAARRFDQKAKVHIKVDTGLGRVGIPHEQALTYIEKVAAQPEITIEGIFTALTEDAAFDRIQLQRLQTICREAEKRGISVGLKHAASSASLLSFPEANLDLVRPGITLYGHYPSDKEFQARKIDLKPVMTLKTRISCLKELKPGDSVSYHRAFMAKEKTLVATLPIGYSDGFPHQMANRGEVVVGGRRYPIIAAVTSNHTILNVTGVQGIQVGDEAVPMGRQGQAEVTAEEIALWSDSSVYKIVIGMSPLLPRVYKAL